MKTNKILYYVTTALMSGLFLFSATMYFTKYEMVSGFFESMSFPTWIVYPLAVAKVLGVIAVWTRKSKLLLEWAYAGFFFDAILAQSAHVHSGHGWMQMALGAIVLTVLSRFFYENVYAK